MEYATFQKHYLKDYSKGTGLARTSPVAQYPDGASPYGVLDMAGNVWECCSSSYKAYPAGSDRVQQDFTTDDWEFRYAVGVGGMMA